MKKLFRIELTHPNVYQVHVYNWVIAEDFNEAIGKIEANNKYNIKSGTMVATEEPTTGIYFKHGGKLIV